ncbi:MAG: hypothetical protein NAG76_17785 [Candidatus Pristimantibacillus lignocellulolyticus]|uniref:Lipoprotein n=1 Tax=Candidatus Pristimantibacillus lignocellulolyticus TaxID=2994561 RepID=A0A9J6ZC37_9BACL|nr:MAG: hypothetical protein NAG76_17785 [Candidatus Pristimantibacillus lignocellulolyticus]
MKFRKTICSILLLIIVCLCGCTTSPDHVIKEVNIQKLNKKAQTFVQTINDRNGLFLYSLINEDQFLIVKYSTVVQGDEAKYLSNITAEIADRILIINIEEMGTDKYDDDRLNKTRIFQLPNEKDYDNIQIFKNGEETMIDSVGV